MKATSFFLVLTLTIAGGAGRAGAAPPPRPAAKSGEAKPAAGKPGEATIPRPSWGKVMGWVVDAATHKAVAGASVALEIGGEFPAAGRGLGKTDAAGKFEAAAPLGRISSNLDW